MRFLAAVGLFGGVGGIGLTSGPALAQAQPASGEVVTVEPTAPSPPQRVFTDASITADVKARLDASQMLRHADIDIVTASGVVTLVGVVPSDFARAQAVELAKSTPSVVRVDNMLRLNVASPEAPSQN
jgi:osmotically-inducible protein OsmY